MASYWIVKHKNMKVLSAGSEWSVDGEGHNWTREQAVFHALLCEFKEQGIPFQLVEIKEKGKELNTK